MDKKQTEIKIDTPKSFTQEEVNELLKKQEGELREKAIEKIKEKNSEIKERENDLLTAGTDTFYDISKWHVMMKMAEDMVKSNALPKGDNAYTVVMKMQAGREMGLKPIESIKSFYIVNGVLSIYGDAVIRRIREHGWTLSYTEAQDTCTATIKKGDEEFSETLTFQDAQKSGWTGNPLKPGWVDGINRRRKLRYGAMSTLVKTYVPEVLGAAADIAEVAEDTTPLYQKAQEGTVITDEDSGKPASETQIETIKTLIRYNDMSAEDKEFNDERFKDLTFGQAAQWTREITSQKKGKK